VSERLVVVSFFFPLVLKKQPIENEGNH